MKKFFIICLGAAFSAVSLFAQQLDPVVEVSRDYQGKLVEVHKPVMEMAAPDTVQTFDLNFDYSVFDSPYKSSGEFSPYVVDMTPAPIVNKPTRLYLQAGAGYTLYPTLDLVWSPVIESPFNIDIYAIHRSYIGKYRALNHDSEWSGYDLLSNVGADLGYEWEKTSMTFGTSYYGVAVKDYLKTRSFNAMDAYVSVKSKSKWPKHFLYDIKLAYRFAEDRSLKKLMEHNLDLDVRFGPSFNKSNKMFFDMGMEMDSYSKGYVSTQGLFFFHPHYIYEKGVMYLDFGLSVSASMRSGAFYKSQIVYPNITMDINVIPDALRMSLKVRGGEKLNSYSSLLSENHHMDLGYALGEPSMLMQPTIERVSAELGFEGRISGFFSYNIRGGYSNFKTSPFDAVLEDVGGKRLPAIAYSKSQKAYAALDWDLNFQSVRFDGSIEYTHSWGYDKPVFAPSALVGDARFEYNWKKRVSVGVDCDFATRRLEYSGSNIIPGYADLGVFAEYAVSRLFSIWLRGGNLLDMEIQRNLFFAEKGINFTAGICLNL